MTVESSDEIVMSVPASASVIVPAGNAWIGERLADDHVAAPHDHTGDDLEEGR